MNLDDCKPRRMNEYETDICIKQIMANAESLVYTCTEILRTTDVDEWSKYFDYIRTDIGDIRYEWDRMNGHLSEAENWKDKDLLGANDYE